MDSIFDMTKSELTSGFEISAVFYDREISGHKILCRKNCNIKRRGTKQDRKQALVIMYNPGSCKPLCEYDGIRPVPAVWDSTQVQLLKLMQYAELDWIEIENLSDICEGKSKKFQELLKQTSDDSHCIFEVNRKNELVIDEKLKVIFAWGKDGEKLKGLVESTINTFSDMHTFGYKKEGKSYYQRPLARFMSKEDRIFWIKEVSDYIKAN